MPGMPIIKCTKLRFLFTYPRTSNCELLVEIYHFSYGMDIKIHFKYTLAEFNYNYLRMSSEFESIRLALSVFFCHIIILNSVGFFVTEPGALIKY